MEFWGSVFRDFDASSHSSLLDLDFGLAGCLAE